MSANASRSDLDETAKAIVGGDRVALGRAITLIESAKPEDQVRAQRLLELLLPRTGRAIRVGIMVKFDDGRSVRVRSLGPHTTIGEMGLITRQVRSATIQAELDSVLYALSFEAYERLKSENRPLHQALLSYVVTVMTERLSFASKVIGVLRR